MRIADLKIRTRLSIGFGTLLVLLLSMLVIALVRFVAIERANEELLTRAWAKADAAHRIDAMVRGNARRLIEAIVTTDATQRNAFNERIDANLARIAKAQEVLDKYVTSGKGKQLLNAVRQHNDTFLKARGSVISALNASQRDTALRIAQQDALPALDAMQAEAVELVTLQQKIVDETGAATSADIVFAKWLLATLGAAATVAGIVAAWSVTRSITRPLARAVEVAERVAQGDLSSRIDVTSRDETGQLMAALKHMNESLDQIVRRVRSGTAAIASASGQLLSGNTNLSARTEEQAASLEETASSMEQLTATVRQNADNARQARQLASNASDIAGEGGRVVERAVTSMQEIAASSTKINDIIGVIDGIAFQTNILALNAAVEAARAGEQGRGFAVVAGEVRTLAQRSAAAAKEIKTLIETSVGKVEDGSAQVRDAGRTMTEIVQAVQRVTDIMGEISAASNEQSGGIEQVNTAVMQMDQVTQQNAALVEEATAAAGSLEDQARQLREAVAVFRLSDGGAYTSGHDGDTDVAANGSRGAVLAFARQRQVA
ncbi:methyl-accepting chemotaxis protein [Pandoraea horticolens]|uniref:Methyl-accepting chemotaxis protein n=1 Tax=Pandoraea horticolens TaxID=2508298 RepID=A0A5E4T7W6_9BURK|nr:methyl-accepting chemotaxis protein [Pandoraea horticolens]VVD83312.1 methyl-accepting chemotaxis protein [Pandoraea horticolens]